MLAAPIAQVSPAASGVIELPLSILITVGTGLVTALVFLFRLLIVNHAKQLKATMDQHDSFIVDAKMERAASTADRTRYIGQLESLVTRIADERAAIQETMVKTLTANTAALESNTHARQSASADMEKLMKEVAGAVILKLSELGYLTPPPARKPAKRKLGKAPGK